MGIHANRNHENIVIRNVKLRQLLKFQSQVFLISSKKRMKGISELLMKENQRVVAHDS